MRSWLSSENTPRNVRFGCLSTIRPWSVFLRSLSRVTRCLDHEVARRSAGKDAPAMIHKVSVYWGRTDIPERTLQTLGALSAQCGLDPRKRRDVVTTIDTGIAQRAEE